VRFGENGLVAKFFALGDQLVELLFRRCGGNPKNRPPISRHAAEVYPSCTNAVLPSAQRPAVQRLRATRRP